MAYIGRNPAIGTQKVLDSLESQFNGTLTTFDLRYNGVPTYPTISSSLIVSLGGVLQEPGEAYYVSSDSIVFASAPPTGADCWILLYSEYGAAAGSGSSGGAVSVATGEPMGYEERTDSDISFNNATRTFTVEPASAVSEFVVWTKGTKRTYSTAQTVQIGTATGLYYIYFDAFGVLQYRTTYFIWDEDTPTAYVYWNATTSSAVFVADERHGIVLDWQTHEYLHRTRGAVIANGFSISNYTTTGDGSADSDAQFDLGNGTFFDEDLEVGITHSATPSVGTFTQVLTGNAEIPVYYMSGSEGDWVKDTATEFACKQSGTTLQYNSLSGSTWSTTAANDNRYIVSWVVATNEINAPIIVILGQDQYSAIGTAEEAVWGDLTLTNFPIFEFRPLWKVIFRTKSTYTNAPNAYIANVLDLREFSSTGTAGTIVSDHGLLSGLTDDDHAQYLNTTVDRTGVTANISTTGNITGANLIATGQLQGPANFIIDPAAVGDNTGTVIIAGDLQIDGTTTTINSTTLTVDDKNIVLASGAANAATADGAGITIDGADATLLYKATPDAWSFNKDVAIGTASPTSYGNSQKTLVIEDDTNPAICISDTGQTKDWWLVGQGDGLTIRYADGGGSGTASNVISSVFFKNNGDVGIGQNSPSSRLDVNGLTKSGGFQATGNVTPTAGHGVEIFAPSSSQGMIQAFDRAGASQMELKLRGSDITFFGTSSTDERLRITGAGLVRVPDNGKFTAGAGDDLQIYHNGTDSIIDNTNGDLYLKTTGSGDDIIIRAADDVIIQTQGSEGAVIARGDGTVELYYDNSKKLETTATGAKVTGALEVTQEYPTIRPTLDLNFAATKSLDRRITFTRDSLGTYTDELGIIRYASNNVPRFDHDPTTGESLGLLIEESRTNTITRSEDWTVGWTDFGVTDTANAATAPDGTDTATKIVADNTNAEHFTQFPSLTSSTNTYYTYSVFCKSAELSSVSINVSASRLYATFNLATGTIITSNSNGTDFDNHSATITSYPNGWFRLTLTGQSLRNTSSEYVRVALSNSSTNTLNSGGVWQGDGTSGIYLWGAQLEVGSFATSYIPTSGSTVTRAADTAKITGTNFTDFYNQTEGTFFVEADTINPTYNDAITGHDGSNNNYTILGTGQSPNRFQIRFDDEEPFQVLAFGPNSTSAITSNVSLTPSLRAKIAGTVKQNEVRGVAQGEIILNDTSFDMISPTALFIGSLDGSSEILPGHVRKVSYYRQALPNAQLQGLTQL